MSRRETAGDMVWRLLHGHPWDDEVLRTLGSALDSLEVHIADLRGRLTTVEQRHAAEGVSKHPTGTAALDRSEAPETRRLARGYIVFDDPGTPRLSVWCVGCVIPDDTRDTLRAHLAHWRPEARFIAAVLVPDEE